MKITKKQKLDLKRHLFNAINNNDPDALKLLPQDLRCQHADKILKNLL